MKWMKKRAESLLKSPEELKKVLTNGLQKAYARRSAIAKIFEDFLLLIRFVFAYVRGEYKASSKKVVIWSVVAILYFISPLDMIPDLLPGGLIDDVVLLTYVISRMRSDLDKFSEWEKKKKTI